MNPAAIGSRLLGLALPEAVARRFALVGFAIACVLLAGAIYAAWQAFDWFNDRDAVADATNEANADFAEDFDQVTGAADVADDAANAEHAAEIRKTEELIDEALKLGCTVSDYLHTNGVVCVRSGAAVRRSAAQ